MLPERPALLRFIRRLVRRSSDADDIVQEAYLRLLECSGRGRESQAGSGYLFVVARNLVADLARREIRERRRAGAFRALQAQLENVAPASDELAYLEQAQERLRGALAELPVRTRQAFLLHRLEGLRYGDIGRRLSVTERTIRRDVTLALTHLKRALFASEES